MVTVIIPKEQLVKLIEAVVADDTSDDLYKVVEYLGEDADNDNERFCDNYELGLWFEEAMDMNDISAITELERIAGEHMKQEAEDREEAKLALEVERGQ